MDVNERLQEILPKIRQAKESTVRDYPDDPDAPTVIEIHRGGDLICTMMCLPNRDLMLMMIKFGIIGMEADSVAYASEVVMTTHPVNPGTGKPWAPDEKQEILRNHPDYWFDGLVEEAMLVSVWDRSGEMAASMQRFVIDGPEVTWGELVTEEKLLGGYITDEISMYWHDETMADQAQAVIKGERPDLPGMAEGLKAEIEAMSDTERLTRQDLSVMAFLKLRLTMMGETAAVTLHAPKDSERSKIIQERAPMLGLGVNDN